MDDNFKTNEPVNSGNIPNLGNDQADNQGGNLGDQVQPPFQNQDNSLNKSQAPTPMQSGASNNDPSKPYVPVQDASPLGDVKPASNEDKIGGTDKIDPQLGGGLIDTKIDQQPNQPDPLKDISSLPNEPLEPQEGTAPVGFAPISDLEGSNINKDVQQDPNSIQTQPGNEVLKEVSNMNSLQADNKTQDETGSPNLTDEDLRRTHEPVIILPDRLEMGQVVNVKVKVGMIPHVMETEHYIQSIELFVNGNSVGKVDFRPQENPIAEADFQLTLTTGMQLKAVEYCNIHGRWESNINV